MSLVAEARLSGARSQRVFDVLLRTMAEPGTVHRFPVADLPAAVPMELWPALALADVDETVSVDHPRAPALGALISDATGAHVAAAEDADLVTTCVATSELLGRVRIGTALAPEDGARVAIAVESLSAHGSNPQTELALSGPGVPGQRRLGVVGLSAEVAACLGRASGTFPTGFDTWLCAADGSVAAISRSTTVDVEEVR